MDKKNGTEKPELIVHDPGNSFIMNEIYVFCSVDEKGEGIVAARLYPGSGLQPLIAVDGKNLKPALDLVKEISKELNKKIILKRFSHPEVIETIIPK